MTFLGKTHNNGDFIGEKHRKKKKMTTFTDFQYCCQKIWHYFRKSILKIEVVKNINTKKLSPKFI